MADQETTPTPTTAPDAAPENPALDDAIRKVFGDDAAEAVGIKPLVKQEADQPAEETEKLKHSKRIIAAQQAALRDAKRRREREEADKKERAELAAERQRIEAEREAVKELAALAEKAKLAKTSPSKLLELSGMTPKDFLQSLATENEPEHVARRVAEETKSETQQLREKLERLEKERQLEAERAKQAEIQREFVNEQRGFVEMVSTRAEEFPHMQTLTERRILGLVDETLARVVGRDEHGRPITELEAFIAESGEPPTNEQIAAYIEQQLAAEADETLSARRARYGMNAPKPSGTTGESKPTPQDSRGLSPRTLPARAASSRAAPKRELTQAEMDEESLAIMRAALTRAG